jgi:mRNA-degrading endonuclease toxin of MazEF toxin-antitoxin module
MIKDFDKWNKTKQVVDSNQPVSKLINEREIWWCNLGLNIGDEQNGKYPNYERPVLITKKFNNKLCVVLPLSSNSGNKNFYKEIFYKNRVGYVIISQIRIISTKRLSRLIDQLDWKQFNYIKNKSIKILR